MRLEHLTNKSATNLYNELSSALMNANQFSIGSAFINEDAINLIEAALKRKKGVNGRILIGVYGFFNKKKDLERLLQLSRDYPSRLEVSISRSVDFHWKYYHFFTGPKQIFYIGSANFTTSGMNDNREMVVKISSSKNKPDSSLSSLSKSFEKEWKNSGTIGTFPIKDYKETKPLPTSGNKIPQSIHDFFNEKERQTDDAVKSDKAYVVFLRSSVKAATLKAISNQKPEWDKKNWSWFVLTQKSLYEQCLRTNEIFVFSREERGTIRCYWAERKDECDTINTDDGKYIVAYKEVKTKKLTKQLIQDLRQRPFSIDLTARKEKFSTKTLGKSQVEKLKEILKIE